MGSQIILGNTFHLWLRPGLDVIRGFGGLHRFENWTRPILTDSGGFQVWSLGEMRKIAEEGVRFASPVNGDKLLLTPEVSMQIQRVLDSDIVMQFDECTAYEPPATVQGRGAHVDGMSLRWAERSRAEFARLENPNALFGIVQGGMFEALREASVAGLVELDLPGYAIGGVSVGEPKAEMQRIVAHTPQRLPETKPRYLMGVGTPEDLLDGVAAGVDMFDCVMPTRNARNGHLFTRFGDLRIRNARYKTDERRSIRLRRPLRALLARLPHPRPRGEILAPCSQVHNLHLVPCADSARRQRGRRIRADAARSAADRQAASTRRPSDRPWPVEPARAVAPAFPPPAPGAKTRDPTGPGRRRQAASLMGKKERHAHDPQPPSCRSAVQAAPRSACQAAPAGAALGRVVDTDAS